MRSFQWVSLQIKQLHTLSSVRDVESRLGKLPKTLKALYDEMYSDIQDTEGCTPVIAERAFKWLMCSYISMSPKALVDAVCQDPFTDAMDDVDDIDLDFVFHACRNLITVDSSGRVCRFSHLSVQEFLENHRFRHREAHELVATICLKYLTFLEASGPRDWSKLHKYAAMHWSLHVQRSYEAAPGDPRVLSLLKRFLGSKEETSPQYSSWLQNVYVVVANTRESSIDQRGTQRLTLSNSLRPSDRVSLPLALFGLHHILPDLWQSIENLDCNGSGMTLLALAAQGGHISTVETLIQAGVDVNSFGSGMLAQTALYTAVETALYNTIDSESIPITQMLLAAGADVNFCAPQRGNAFDNYKGQYCSNALQLAARTGNVPLVDLLLAAGARVNMVDGYYGTALQAGCYSRSPRSGIVASRLLKAGADVNLQGGKYGNALQASSTVSGNEATVKILLDAGADIHGQGGNYGNALQAAASEGDEAIIKVLLSAGADVNTQGGEYGNALQAASYIRRLRSNETSVKILLGAGADVNAQGGQFGTALQAASSYGNDAVVDLLLSAGAGANAQGGLYGNALQAASFIGKDANIKKILSAGADVNAQGGLYGNALDAAIAKRHTDLVKMLLAEGADVNAQAGPYGSALELAASNHSGPTRQLLLGAGADIERIGRFGKPLSAAFIGGVFNIVRSFLATGCDMSTLEVDIEQWLEMGPELYHDYNAPSAVKRIFRRPSRAAAKILKHACEWLEDDANRHSTPLIVGPEGNECKMRAYMERGRVHLEKIKRRMQEADGWEEDDFDESYIVDSDSDAESDSESDPESD